MEDEPDRCPARGANTTDAYQLADQWPTFESLRREAPVHPIRHGDRTIWVVTGDGLTREVEDGSRFCVDPTTVFPESAAAIRANIPPWARPLVKSLATTDQPDHAILRRLVGPCFSPAAVEVMRDEIARVVEELIDARVDHGAIELRKQFALPMAATVFARFIGFPEEDRARVVAWTDVLVRRFTAETPDASERAAVEFMAYIHELIRARRDRPGVDVITVLIGAYDRDEIDEESLVALVLNIMGGGFQTTATLLTNAALALVHHPDQMRLLRRRPELVGNAVEELLRFGGAGPGALRYSREDTVLGGVEIPRGAAVMPLFSSANFDPARFDRPNDLDISRSVGSHLSFGWGAHYCLGAPLARLEAEVSLEALSRRLPNMRLADCEPNPEWQEKTPFAARIESLWLVFDPQE